MNGVSPEKEWAVSLSKEEFFHEFTRRNPCADSIPDKDEWLAVKVREPEYVFNGVSPEDYVTEGSGHVKTVAPEMEPIPAEPSEEGKETPHYDKVFKCRGCGKEIRSRLATVNHEKACRFVKDLKK